MQSLVIAVARRSCLALLIISVAGVVLPTLSHATTTNYLVQGVIKEIKPAEHQLVIAHEDIPDFMEAMTMPFNVKDATILTNVVTGAKITFKLHVTESESWVDDIKPVIGAGPELNSGPALSKAGAASRTTANPPVAALPKNPLRDYKFTNELGQPVSLSDFHGQAIALTFIFTRCPIPEYCPRLSKNFQEVQQRFKQMENAPTNWHLLSVTFDPARDTPEVLKRYGMQYQYDSAHWSFLTGPGDKIAELARFCDVKFDPDNGSFNHNFRTLIVDASNRLQMVFPTSGNLSESIVQELLKATNPTNQVKLSATDTIHRASHR